MNQAIFIKNLEGWNGDARLYKLVPPMTHVTWNNVVETHEYVVVSAVVVPFSGAETYIFATDENGYVENYGELEGSFRGGLDHERALNGAGYSVCGPSPNPRRRRHHQHQRTPGASSMTQYICIGYADGAWYSFAHGQELPNSQTQAVAVALIESEVAPNDFGETSNDHDAAVIDTLEATGNWKLGPNFKRPFSGD